MTRRKFIKNTVLASPIILVPNYNLNIFQNDLPNILIIGDSISIGYTSFVRELLKNKAVVFRPMIDEKKAENCAGTTKGIENIDRWLGDKKWDIIHFNFGLHDIKHVDPNTGENSKNKDHPQQANPKQYRKNLKIIVEKLKATGAKLIFATTTPYPDNVGGPLRKNGMPEKYNRIAIKIMNSNEIAINDLYTFMKSRMNVLQQENNVHFTPAGYNALADKVIDRINDML